MKLFLVLLVALFSLSSFASNLAQDLSSKSCSLDIKKTISIKKKELAIEVGDTSIMSLFHNKNIKLGSRQSYPILDVSSDGVIAFNKGATLLLFCINDGDSCLKDLSKINRTDIYELSGRTLEINCK